MIPQNPTSSVIDLIKTINENDEVEDLSEDSDAEIEVS